VSNHSRENFNIYILVHVKVCRSEQHILKFILTSEWKI
jgi:hypothetical protein